VNIFASALSTISLLQRLKTRCQGTPSTRSIVIHQIRLCVYMKNIAVYQRSASSVHLNIPKIVV
ncbi:hypothetical protein RUND412_011072, partial [Rhizina undulata]